MHAQFNIVYISSCILFSFPILSIGRKVFNEARRLTAARSFGSGSFFMYAFLFVFLSEDTQGLLCEQTNVSFDQLSSQCLVVCDCGHAECRAGIAMVLLGV